MFSSFGFAANLAIFVKILLKSAKYLIYNIFQAFNVNTELQPGLDGFLV